MNEYDDNKQVRTQDKLSCLNYLPLDIKEWNMRGLWCAILIFLVASGLVNADDKDPNDPNALSRTKWEAVIKDPNDPNELLQVKCDAVFLVMQAKDLDKKAKESQIRKIMVPVFDFPLMAKLVLGKKHWPRLTPPQQEKFTRLFVEWLKTSYCKKIMLYEDEKAVLKPPVRKGKAIYIPMQLISKDKKIAIIYKLRKAERRWKIYDVEIQGVSVLLTYRSQFDDILRRGTVEDFLSRLEKPPTR